MIAIAASIVASRAWRPFWAALAVLVVLDSVAEYCIATPDRRVIGPALVAVFVVRALGSLWLIVIGTRLAVVSRPPLAIDRGLLFAFVYEFGISGAFTFGFDALVKPGRLDASSVNYVGTIAEMIVFAPFAPWLTNLYANARFPLGAKPQWRSWLPALLIALIVTAFPLTVAHGYLTDAGVAAHGTRAAMIGVLDGLLATVLLGWQIALNCAPYLRVVGRGPAR